MKNKHGVSLTDIYYFNYYGINVFLEVTDKNELEAKVRELETFKLKDTSKYFNKWKKEHPGEKVSKTGWAETLKGKRRSKKICDCLLLPLSGKNNLSNATLSLRTWRVKNEPTLLVYINRKTRLYWEAKKRILNPKQGIMFAKPLILYEDKLSDRRKKINYFYPYIKPEAESEGEVVEA